MYEYIASYWQTRFEELIKFDIFWSILKTQVRMTNKLTITSNKETYRKQNLLSEIGEQEMSKIYWLSFN